MADEQDTSAGSAARNILQTKFFYVASIFAVSFGTVSFLWRYKSVNWVVILFGVVWVFVVTAFAWEVVTRAEKLDRKVQSRTRALKETNAHLSTLIDQITIFHHLSHRMNQKVTVPRISRTFVRELQQSFDGLDSVWLWLDERIMGSVDGDDAQHETGLSLVAVGGNEMGRPEELTNPESHPDLVTELVFDGTFRHYRNLRDVARREGWNWLTRTEVKEFAGYPLDVGETTIGALGIFSATSMTPNFLNHLHLSVNQLAMALEKARLLRGYQDRARDLAEANAELRKLDTMKNWFLSAVSHELKTPLTSIRSFSEILQNYQDLSPGEMSEFAGIIREESERLSTLINDMLDAASIADGRMEWNPVPTHPGELIRRSCKLFSYSVENRRLTLEQDVPEDLPQVRADEGKIVTVLNNLIGNAVKFTEPGGTIRVSAAVHDGDGRLVSIAVSDNGRGIPKEHQARVFEKFTRLGQPLGGHPPGAGLGLAISKEIVERHGGTIRVESQPDEGSTFTLTLPALEEEEAVSAGDEKAPEAGGEAHGEQSC